MRAQLSIESLSFMPSSAWAARPLASGARFKLIVARSVRCLGVGCPSFGGQRAFGGGSLRPFAARVSGSLPRRASTGFEVVGSWFNSQTARPAAKFGVAGLPENRWAVVGRCHGQVAALGKVKSAGSSWVGLTETAKSASLSRQSRASFAVGVESRLARWSPTGWPAMGAATSAPNHSVKGTNCGEPQFAPYLER